MRGKLAKELELRSAELQRIGAQLEIAVDRDDDTVALALIARRDSLKAEVERLSSEVETVTREAEEAKRNLVTFRNDIAELKEEKTRMLARWGECAGSAALSGNDQWVVGRCRHSSAGRGARAHPPLGGRGRGAARIRRCRPRAPARIDP